MAGITLIADTTAGATVSDIDVYGRNCPCTLVADGLAGAETVTINVQSDSGYVAFNSTDGFANGTTGITLTATAPAFTIRAPGKYQAVLSTTVGNTSVHMVSEAHQ